MASGTRQRPGRRIFDLRLDLLLNFFFLVNTTVDCPEAAIRPVFGSRTMASIIRPSWRSRFGFTPTSKAVSCTVGYGVEMTVR